MDKAERIKQETQPADSHTDPGLASADETALDPVAAESQPTAADAGYGLPPVSPGEEAAIHSSPPINWSIASFADSIESIEDVPVPGVIPKSQDLSLPTGARPADPSRKAEIPQVPDEEVQKSPRKPKLSHNEKLRRAELEREAQCFRVAVALGRKSMDRSFGSLDPLLATLSGQTGIDDAEKLDATRKYMVGQGLATFTVDDDTGAKFQLTKKGRKFRADKLAEAAQRARLAGDQGMSSQ